MQDAFGDFKVLERLGAGTKAETWRARDTRAGRTVAIKVLTSDLAMDPVLGAPFVDEAYLAQKLGHPNTAALYDIGEQDGRPHLVYEFIQGQPLTSVLAGQPINPRRALELAAQVADGLADAHALGVVHRALRPDKVIVSLKGNAKVLDCGLGLYATAVTRQLVAAGGAQAAAAQRIMAYWAPEQTAGPGDARSDLYALGLVLMEMLTGRAPERIGARPEITAAPAVVQPLLARLLAEAPEHRVESAATVAAELRQLVAVLEAQRDAPPMAATPATTAAASTIPTVPATPAAPAAPKSPAAAATPSGRKSKPGVTVTSPSSSPGAATAGPPSKPGTAAHRKGGSQKPRSQGAAATAPASRPPAAPAARPQVNAGAAGEAIDVAGLGKTAAVIAAAVLLLLAILYFVFP